MSVYDMLVDEFRVKKKQALELAINYDMAFDKAKRNKKAQPDFMPLSKADDAMAEVYDRMYAAGIREGIPKKYIGLKRKEYATINSKLVDDRVRQRIDEIRMLPKEMLYMLDEWGNVIARGGYDSEKDVTLLKWTDRIKALGNAYDIHNHPSTSKPHSDNDIVFCATYRSKKCLVVNRHNTHQIEPPHRGWGARVKEISKHTSKTYMAEAITAREKMGEKKIEELRGDYAAMEYANSKHIEGVVKKVAKKHGFTYSVEPVKVKYKKL